MAKNQFNPAQEKWLETLESGRYKQGIGHLWEFLSPNKRKKGFCCLGVAMEEFFPGSTQMSVSPHNEWCSRGAVATSSLVKKLHLRDDCGHFYQEWYRYLKNKDLRSISHPPSLKALTEANDEQGWSFKRIARFIRKHPWIVFTNFTPPKEVNPYNKYNV